MLESALVAAFNTPPPEYRTMPLWIWNGEMSEARITETLEQFAGLGQGGVFIHPRMGLITEYLSERWIELWGHALRECKRLGLICNIYDENGFPSGIAGGHVPARVPHAAMHYLKATLCEHSPLALTGQLHAAYRMAAGRAIRLKAHEDAAEVLKAQPLLILERIAAPGGHACRIRKRGLSAPQS